MGSTCLRLSSSSALGFLGEVSCLADSNFQLGSGPLYLTMAPRRPDRITRSVAHLQDPVSIPVDLLHRVMLTTTVLRFLDGLGDTEKQQEWSQDEKISLEVHDNQ